MLSLSIRKIKTPEWLEVNKRLRTAILVFAGLALADLLVYFLVVSPSSAMLASTEAKYAELRRRHAEAVLFRKQKPLFAGISAGITTQKDMPLLVKEVVQTARRLNLKVEAVNYDMPSHGSGELAQLSFSFPAEGRYPEIKRFIYDVETADRFIGVQELKLDSEQGKVKLQMKLMTY
ncbi:MAG TPA: type 4a pilus biogenesis protein PilO, partial [Nitrospirota bacterium]